MSSEQGTVLLIVTWVLCAVTIGVVGMRLYADAFILHKIRVDSYIILITFLFVITQQIFTTLMVHSGMGQHVKSLTPAQIELSLKYSWIAQPMQLFANSLGKLAVVAYLTTIHGPSNARLKLSFIWSVGASQFVSVVICITLIFLQCTPLPKLWDETIEGTCDGRLRNQNFAYFQGALSALTDLILAIYPVFLFWSLRMKVAKKVVLCVLFGFGLLATVCSIGKTINLSRITQVTDITYFLATLIIWNATEMYIVILAGSVPTLRPFVKRHLFKSTTDRDYRKGASHRLDDEANLTGSSFAHGRTKTLAIATGKSSGGVSDERDSTEDFIHNMSNGSIMLTTQVDVDRYNERGASAGTAL